MVLWYCHVCAKQVSLFPKSSMAGHFKTLKFQGIFFCPNVHSTNRFGWHLRTVWGKCVDHYQNELSASKCGGGESFRVFYFCFDYVQVIGKWKRTYRRGAFHAVTGQSGRVLQNPESLVQLFAKGARVRSLLCFCSFWYVPPNPCCKPGQLP